MEENKTIPKTNLSLLRSAFIGRRDNRKVRTFQLDITQRSRLTLGALNLFLGLFTVGLGIYVAVDSYRTYHEFYWPTVINLLIGGGLTGFGLWTLHLYRRISRLSSVKDTCARFGIDTQELQAVAEGRDIKPQFNIGGQDFYDLRAFGDVSTLLRASAAPANRQETLLRPAAQTETPPELLLRATQVASAGDERN